MRYFVTGGTGFIGRRVVAELLDAGHQVNALVRSKATAEALGASVPGISAFQGDITDKQSMRAAMEGVDGVFHLAAWYRIGARDKTAAEFINVEGTRNVLELMRELGIAKGVYTSTVAVFSDTRGKVPEESHRHRGVWLSEYERTKAMAHYEVAEPMIRAGLPLVIVQPGVVYGPGDPSAIGDMFRQYLRRKLPMVPEGAAYSWAHVDDTARGHMLAMEKGQPGESYIIAGPVHTVTEALAMAERITGIPAPRKHVRPPVLKMLALVMSLVETVVPVPERYASETLRLAAGRTYLGFPAKAERELGFRARPLEAGLSETLPEEMKRLGIAG
jgi:nucleoside-diphosphate-sugar epimerase